jgi:hypothetical protein
MRSGRGGEPRRADYGCVGCDFQVRCDVTGAGKHFSVFQRKHFSVFHKRSYKKKLTFYLELEKMSGSLLYSSNKY